MKQLTVRNLKLAVDGYGEDPVKEAREVLEAVNDALDRLEGCPVLEFDLKGTADIEAYYEEISDG